jgi:hypothetical protein
VRFSPYKRLNEGAIDVTLTKDIKRWESVRNLSCIVIVIIVIAN